MKRLISIIFIILLFVSFAGQAWGATYYVSQSGAGDGSTSSTPDSLADFEGGVFGELDDDTVYILDTISNNTISMPDGGTSGHPVTLRLDYPGHEAILTGLVTEAGPWNDEGGNVYSTALPTECSWVIYNGTLLTLESDITPAEGGFYWDSSVLYINVGEDPSTGTVQITQIAVAISTEGNDYIDIVGGTIEYIGNGSSLSVTGGIYGFNCDYITVSGTTFNYIDGPGVNGRHSGGGSSTGRTVTNCVFYECAQAVRFTRINSTITTYNAYHGSLDRFIVGGFVYGDADDAGYSYNHYIAYNIVTHSMGSDVAVSNTAGEDSYIVCNVLVGGGDIISIEDSSNINIYNNIAYKSIDTGFYPCLKIGNDFGAGDPSDYLNVKNNIFYQTYSATQTKKVITASGTGGPGIGTHCTFSNNLLYFKDAPVGYDYIGWWEVDGSSDSYTFTEFQAYQAGKYTTDSINENPLFVNAAGGDFRLKVGSPCIDAGTDVGLTEDYIGYSVPFGSAPDIGAYEFHVGTSIKGVISNGYIQ